MHKRFWLLLLILTIAAFQNCSRSELATHLSNTDHLLMSTPPTPSFPDENEESPHPNFPGMPSDDQVQDEKEVKKVDEDMSKKGVKFNPGFYIQTGILKKPPEGKTLLGDSSTLWQHPNVKGVLVKLSWKSLEPKKNQYDFSLIDLALKELEDFHDKRYLIAALFVRGDDMPEYLSTEGLTALTGWGNYYPKLWEKNVMDRLIKLAIEIGKKYDNHPRFEGLQSYETAISMTNGQSGFSCEKYTREFVRLTEEVNRSLEQTTFFTSVSYLCSKESGMEQIAQELLKHGGGIAWPDTKRSRVMDGEWIAKNYRGKIPAHAGGDTTYYTYDLDYEKDVYKYAVENLGMTHLMFNSSPWTRRDERLSNDKDHHHRKIKEVLDKYPEFGKSINATCPTSIAPCIRGG